MSTTQVTPEALTLQDVTRWKGQEMREQMKRPGMREAVDRVLQNLSLEQVQAAEEVAVAEAAANVPQPTPEEQAAADAVVAAQVEADRVAAEQVAATSRAEAEVARVAAEEAAKPKKFVMDYQVRDEEGNPIGRPTHFEATTEEELRAKVQEAHIQAARAFHRLKKQKLTVRQPEVLPQPGMTDDEMMAAIRQTRSDDPKVAIEAQKKLTKNEVDQQLEADKRRLAEETENLRQANVSLRFLKKHLTDFNNCEANVKLIASYIEENQLEWTDDNIEAAFLARESELAPVEPVVQTAPVNPEPTAPVAPVVTVPAVPAAASVVQPTPPAPAPAAAPVNPAPVAAPKPGVNAGLVPGQNSGVRPAVTKPAGLTIAEIRAMDAETYKAALRNPAKRAEIEKAVLAHNQARGR